MNYEIKSEADLLELGRLTAFGPVVVASGERDVWVCFPTDETDRAGVPHWIGLEYDPEIGVTVEYRQRLLFEAAELGQVYVLYAPSRAGS